MVSDLMPRLPRLTYDHACGRSNSLTPCSLSFVAACGSRRFEFSLALFEYLPLTTFEFSSRRDVPDRTVVFGKLTMTFRQSDLGSGAHLILLAN